MSSLRKHIMLILRVELGGLVVGGWMRAQGPNTSFLKDKFLVSEKGVGMYLMVEVCSM